MDGLVVAGKGVELVTGVVGAEVTTQVGVGRLVVESGGEIVRGLELKPTLNLLNKPNPSGVLPLSLSLTAPLPNPLFPLPPDMTLDSGAKLELAGRDPERSGALVRRLGN